MYNTSGIDKNVTLIFPQVGGDGGREVIEAGVDAEGQRQTGGGSEGQGGLDFELKKTVQTLSVTVTVVVNLKSVFVNNFHSTGRPMSS